MWKVLQVEKVVAICRFSIYYMNPLIAVREVVPRFIPKLPANMEDVEVGHRIVLQQPSTTIQFWDNEKVIVDQFSDVKGYAEEGRAFWN